MNELWSWRVYVLAYYKVNLYEMLSEQFSFIFSTQTVYGILIKKIRYWGIRKQKPSKIITIFFIFKSLYYSFNISSDNEYSLNTQSLWQLTRASIYIFLWRVTTIRCIISSISILFRARRNIPFLLFCYKILVSHTIFICQVFFILWIYLPPKFIFAINLSFIIIIALF